MPPPDDDRRPGAILLLVLLAAGLVVGLVAAQTAGPSGTPPSPKPQPSQAIVEPVTLVLDDQQLLLPSIAGLAGPLFALEPVAERLGLNVLADPSGEGRTMDVAGSLVTLQAGSATITVGQTIATLTQAALQVGDQVFVPADFFERAFAELLGMGVVWSPAERQLFLGRGALRTIAVRVQQVHWQGVTTVALELDAPQRYRVESRLDRAVEIIFPGQRLSVAPFVPGTDEDALVRRIAVLGDRVRLDLAPEAAVDSYELRDPFRIVVDVQQGAAATPPDVAPAPGALEPMGAMPPGVTLRPTTPKRTPSIETIVIDPGHGGDETGALGTRGSAEKDLTLELARALRDRLRARLPVRVALTRDEDATLSLTARSAVANQYRADLFVSIHLNSSLGATAHGAETYFLSIEASDERAALAAAAENAAATARPEAGLDGDGAPETELELLLWDLAQSRHLARSQRVAMLIQEELNQALGLRDRGVKQAPFRVLMGANMPAVLVELGFLSNPEEEAKLKQASYRHELVEALVRAIGRYRAELLPQPLPPDAIVPGGAG